MIDYSKLPDKTWRTRIILPNRSEKAKGNLQHSGEWRLERRKFWGLGWRIVDSYFCPHRTPPGYYTDKGEQELIKLAWVIARGEARAQAQDLEVLYGVSVDGSIDSEEGWIELDL